MSSSHQISLCHIQFILIRYQIVKLSIEKEIRVSKAKLNSVFRFGLLDLCMRAKELILHSSISTSRMIPNVIMIILRWTTVPDTVDIYRKLGALSAVETQCPLDSFLMVNILLLVLRQYGQLPLRLHPSTLKEDLALVVKIVFFHLYLKAEDTTVAPM